MEDLREQIQNQDITFSGNKTIWTITLNKEMLFNETSVKSMYFIKQNAKEPVSSDANVILDDDRNLYNIYMENALQELKVALARRIDCNDNSAVIDDANTFAVNLIMGDNHDGNILIPLNVACKEFVIKKTLEQWYNIDFGSEMEKSKIVHLLQYRRKSVARRVRPLL